MNCIDSDKRESGIRLCGSRIELGVWVICLAYAVALLVQSTSEGALPPWRSFAALFAGGLSFSGYFGLRDFSVRVCRLFCVFCACAMAVICGLVFWGVLYESEAAISVVLLLGRPILLVLVLGPVSGLLLRFTGYANASQVASQ